MKSFPRCEFIGPARAAVPILTTALLFSPVVTAQQDWREVDWGELMLRLGVSYVSPEHESSPFQYAVLQHLDFYNTRWDFNSDTSPSFSLSWRPLEYWGAEIMHIGAAHYDVDLRGFGPGLTNGSIPLGEFEATSSNAFINWYPVGEQYFVRPYAGIGINYTDYHDASLAGELEAFLAQSDAATGGGDLQLSYSWGPVAQLGADFSFGPESDFLANIAVLYFKSDSDATITFPTTTGVERLYSDVDYDPWVFNLGMSYRF